MEDELQPEYEFDFSKAKPNRFAGKFQKGSRLVVLSPENAAVFQSSEEVNAVLKALVNTMPARAKKVGKPVSKSGPKRRRP